jgi:chaperonin cofactor prefoldin
MAELVPAGDAVPEEDTDPDVILAKYKQMLSECQQLTSKIQQLNADREEHKLVVEKLAGLEPERKAFRLVANVLVERTVGEVLPVVSQHYEGVSRWVHGTYSQYNLYAWLVVIKIRVQSIFDFYIPMYPSL